MLAAVELARQGEGRVEPNPMVGCVVVADGQLIAGGHHEFFGGPHAEVIALRQVDDRPLDSATLYVTLEPCAHYGKTPPCVDLLLKRRPARVCVGCIDPNPATRGRGVETLRTAGIEVTVDVAASACEALIAPFRKRIERGLPFVIAKWAMTLDGRIASHTGNSQWISGEHSRAIVHRLRGRCDAIAVGARTAALDDPLLTARPPGPRTPLRVVFDRRASLSPESRLARTAREFETIIFCEESNGADLSGRLSALQEAGVRAIPLPAGDGQLEEALRHLVALGCTNILVEGGGGLIGSFFDSRLIDEVHVFVAAKIIGGQNAIGPVGGAGIATFGRCVTIDEPLWENSGEDMYLRGRLDYSAAIVADSLGG